MTYRPAIFRSSTWGALLYALVDLPWTISAFTLIFTLMAVGGALTIIYVGIPILMFAVLLARGAARAQLGLGAGLLGWSFHLRARDASRQRATTERRGLWRVVVDTLCDRDAWRALAYFAVKLVWAPLVFAVSVFFYAGLGMVTYPVWRPLLPEQIGSDGALHRGATLWNGTFIDTWPSITIYALIGVVLVLVIPYALRALLRADQAIARAALL